jgi:hypothetical protein
MCGYERADSSFDLPEFSGRGSRFLKAAFAKGEGVRAGPRSVGVIFG